MQAVSGFWRSSQHFVSGQLGQHEIENDQVGPALQRKPQAFFAVGSGDHFISSLL
jgi:hypothetical protein